MWVGSAFEGAARAGEVDQNAAHQLSRDSEEMSAVPPAHVVGINQLEVSLIDQRGGLEGVAGPFSSHVALRQSVQFPVH